MKRWLLVVVILVFVASFVSAQTVERHLDLTSLGWGLIDVRAIETDGDPSTREWAVWEVTLSEQPGRWRVVIERPHGVCAGPWFDPRTVPWATVRLSLHGDRHKLDVSVHDFFGGKHLTVVSLDTPTCGPID